MNFVIIIPARFSSSRFPGKLLSNIHGKPMIVRVVEKALTTKASKIIVATDSNVIMQTIKLEYSCTKNKIETCLTRPNHQSGTERLSEVIQRYQLKDDQCIVHLQADEPLISSDMIHQMVQILYMNSANISVTTLATPILSEKEFEDTNVVKVVTNMNNDALYFSRSRIPWINHYNQLDPKFHLLLRHIGVYAYFSNFVHRYMQWDRSPLEKLEMLEQLRVLWYGEKIRVSILHDVSIVSVDTPESLKQVNDLFYNK